MKIWKVAVDAAESYRTVPAMLRTQADYIDDELLLALTELSRRPGNAKAQPVYDAMQELSSVVREYADHIEGVLTIGQDDSNPHRSYPPTIRTIFKHQQARDSLGIEDTKLGNAQLQLLQRFHNYLMPGDRTALEVEFTSRLATLNTELSASRRKASNLIELVKQRTTWSRSA